MFVVFAAEQEQYMYCKNVFLRLIMVSLEKVSQLDNFQSNYVQTMLRGPLLVVCVLAVDVIGLAEEMVGGIPLTLPFLHLSRARNNGQRVSGHDDWPNSF